MFVCNLLWLDSLPAHGVPVKPAEQAQAYMFNPLVQSSLTKHGIGSTFVDICANWVTKKVNGIQATRKVVSLLTDSSFIAIGTRVDL